MQFIVEGQRIATENFVPGRLYTILFKTETQVNLTCISTGAGCVTFKGEAPINLFTLSMRNADTIDTIEPTQLGTNNYNNLINKPAINGVTLTGNISLADLGAAAASDIPTTPGDIGAEPAITSDNKLDPSLIDYDSTHAAITSAQVEQIGTNQTNISSFHKSDNTDIYFSETEPTGNITVGSYLISSHSTNIYIKTQNLAPPLSEWEAGYIDANGALHAPSNPQQEKTTPYIAIDSTNYVCTSDFTDGTVGRWKCAAYYDENKAFISRATSYDNGAWSLTAPANAAFIRLSFRTYGENKEIMLNAGTVPLPYEPQYKWDTLGVQYNTYIKGINHRGYNTIAPENTIPAYILSKKMGFDYVETDISFTSDGVAVLLHDNTIDRTSDGTGNISEMTYAQVSQYDFGSWKSAVYTGTKIPTFDEFIQFCRDVGLKVYAELKGSPTQTQVDNVCNIVKKYGMENNVSWIAFDSTALEKVLTDIPTARVGFLINTATSTAVTTTAALKTSDNSVFLDCSSISDSVISDAITALVPVELWTVNTIAGITSANGYISGFTSDTINASRIIADYALNQ